MAKKRLSTKEYLWHLTDESLEEIEQDRDGILYQSVMAYRFIPITWGDVDAKWNDEQSVWILGDRDVSIEEMIEIAFGFAKHKLPQDPDLRQAIFEEFYITDSNDWLNGDTTSLMNKYQGPVIQTGKKYFLGKIS